MRPLVDYLPPHIAADDEVRYIEEALTVIMEREWAANEDLVNQIFPQRATWTLRYWERFFGIRTDVDLTDAQRRADLLARIRGAQTATVDAVRALCETYTDGVVTVAEYPAEYRVEILIEDFEVSPTWTGAMEAALKEFLPAHLTLGVRMSVKEATTEYAHAATLGWCMSDTTRALSI